MSFIRETFETGSTMTQSVLTQVTCLGMIPAVSTLPPRSRRNLCPTICAKDIWQVAQLHQHQPPKGVIPTMTMIPQQRRAPTVHEGLSLESSPCYVSCLHLFCKNAVLPLGWIRRQLASLTCINNWRSWRVWENKHILRNILCNLLKTHATIWRLDWIHDHHWRAGGASIFNRIPHVALNAD